MSNFDYRTPVSALRGVGPKKVEAFEKEELLRRIYAGEIRDAKTVAGIMAYAAMGV